jgi:hypothetical protein
MEAILAGLALVLIIVFVILLVVLRAGIRRQERAASLTCQPGGFSAALARRVLGLYAFKPSGINGLAEADSQASLTPDEKGAHSS